MATAPSWADVRDYRRSRPSAPGQSLRCRPALLTLSVAVRLRSDFFKLFDPALIFANSDVGEMAWHAFARREACAQPFRAGAEGMGGKMLTPR
jgi:hypothetical protein